MFNERTPDNSPKRNITIGRPRKDGKYLVKFNYPFSGKTFGKLLSHEEMEKVRDGGEYLVR